MTNTPSAVANFFLEKAEEEKRPITQMKLLKLVYIAYGWVLALTDRKLFEEKVMAWPHGPVIPSLYHEFKKFGHNPIEGRALDVDLDTGKETIPHINPEEKQILLILEKVWDIYKVFSSGALRNKTHEDDSPWREHFGEGQMSYETIPANEIKSHFKKKINQYLNAAE